MQPLNYAIIIAMISHTVHCVPLERSLSLSLRSGAAGRLLAVAEVQREMCSLAKTERRSLYSPQLDSPNNKAERTHSGLFS